VPTGGKVDHASTLIGTFYDRMSTSCWLEHCVCRRLDRALS